MSAHSATRPLSVPPALHTCRRREDCQCIHYSPLLPLQYGGYGVGRTSAIAAILGPDSGEPQTKHLCISFSHGVADGHSSGGGVGCIGGCDDPGLDSRSGVSKQPESQVPSGPPPSLLPGQHTWQRMSVANNSSIRARIHACCCIHACASESAGDLLLNTFLVPSSLSLHASPFCFPRFRVASLDDCGRRMCEGVWVLMLVGDLRECGCASVGVCHCGEGGWINRFP